MPHPWPSNTVKVITQQRLVDGRTGIDASCGGTGSAGTLPMSDEEKDAAAAREPKLFGFHPASSQHAT